VSKIAIMRLGGDVHEKDIPDWVAGFRGIRNNRIGFRQAGNRNPDGAAG